MTMLAVQAFHYKTAIGEAVAASRLQRVAKSLLLIAVVDDEGRERRARRAACQLAQELVRGRARLDDGPLIRIPFDLSLGSIDKGETAFGAICNQALAPGAADAWSVDARRHHDSAVASPSETHGWPLKLMAALTCLTYVLAGIAIARRSFALPLAAWRRMSTTVLRDRRARADATLRAAAPWQKLRGSPETPAGTAGARPIAVRASDFRIRRHEAAQGTLTIFVVDASGSAALHRLGEAKGAVEMLLADCYVRRDSVALIAFKGLASTIELPPTRSLTRAKRMLAGLREILASGARLHYIVGNSTFYGELLSVEKIYARIMAEFGFTDIDVRPIRKRNSKKELVEFDVSAKWL